MAREHGLARHQRARAALLAAFVPGQPCARCGGPLRVGEGVHADHLRTPLALDPTALPDALSHARCNVYAGWVLGYMTRQRRLPPPHPDPALERVRVQVTTQALQLGHLQRSAPRLASTRQSRDW